MNGRMFSLMGRFRMAMFFAVFGALALGMAYAQILPSVPPTSSQQYTLSSTLCGIIAGISEIIGLLAIFMFVVGGTLYAFAHFMPAAGNLKGSMQGWGMGILMGGIIMVVLYALAPFIISTVLKFSLSSSINVQIPTASGVSCAGIGFGGI